MKTSSSTDLRVWLRTVEQMGELQAVEGADWNLELGAIAELNTRLKPTPALIFDKIKDYPAGDPLATDGIGPTMFGSVVPLFANVHSGYNKLIYADTAGAKFSSTIAVNIGAVSYNAGTYVLTIPFTLTGAAANALPPRITNCLPSIDTGIAKQ